MISSPTTEMTPAVHRAHSKSCSIPNIVIQQPRIPIESTNMTPEAHCNKSHPPPSNAPAHMPPRTNHRPQPLAPILLRTRAAHWHESHQLTQAPRHRTCPDGELGRRASNPLSSRIQAGRNRFQRPRGAHFTYISQQQRRRERHSDAQHCTTAGRPGWARLGSAGLHNTAALAFMGARGNRKRWRARRAS